MKKPIKRVATIHDLCGVGKAALTNIIPVLSVLGVEVCPIPTMILSTHTGGFGSPKIVKLDGYINDSFEHYKNINMNFEGIFIGYLGSTKNVEETLTLLENMKHKSNLVILDPIFGDGGQYYSNFDKSYSENLKKLLQYSNIITPNFTEACILADEKIQEEVDEDKLVHISKKLTSLGCENIVITSVPIKDKSKIGVSIYNSSKNSIKIIESTRLPKSYPGTGDIFAAVLVGKLMEEKSIEESVKESCEFIYKCIEESSKYEYETREGVLLERNLKYLIN